MTNHEQFDSSLSDALWWFHGFAAAQPLDEFGRSHITHHLAHSLGETRIWLNRLAEGSTRLLGTNERSYAVVLTEAEFERIFEALRDGATSDEVANGRAAAALALQQFTEERRAAAAGEALF